MKKTAVFLLLVMTAMYVCSLPVMAADNISITIDGEELVPKNAVGEIVPPFVENGTTYVPVRAIASAFDLSIDWEQETKTVFIGPKGGQSVLNDYINIYIGGEEFIAKDVSGQRVYPILRDGTTYLPIRAIGEALGKNVFWDNVTKTAVLITPADDAEREAFKHAFANTIEAPDLEVFTVVEVISQGESSVSENIYPMTSDNLISSIINDDVLKGSVSCSGSEYYASVDPTVFLKVLQDGSSEGAEELSRVDIYVNIADGKIEAEKLCVVNKEDTEIKVENVVSKIDYEEEEE